MTKTRSIQKTVLLLLTGLLLSGTMSAGSLPGNTGVVSTTQLAGSLPGNTGVL